MRAAAITFWVILFPDNEGQMAAFGFVQHNFFILFNALLGLVFWRKAQESCLTKRRRPTPAIPELKHSTHLSYACGRTPRLRQAGSNAITMMASCF